MTARSCCCVIPSDERSEESKNLYLGSSLPTAGLRPMAQDLLLAIGVLRLRARQPAKAAGKKTWRVLRSG